MMIGRQMLVLAAAGMAGTLASNACALVFYSTGSSTYNTSAPTGSLSGSGWQWQGDWNGWYTGTPIAPQFFVTANHTAGTLGSSLTLNGVNYKTVAFPDGSSYKQIAGTDLRIWKISGTFSSYAPLYTTADGSEVGKTFVILGRGGQRGSEVRVPSGSGTLKGWQTANSGDAGFDHVRRWGQNQVTGITNFSTTGDNQELYYYFDASGSGNVGANEAMPSLGDSGGGVFIQVGSKWKLAGLTWAVSGPFSYTQSGSTFNAALFDRGGLYDASGGSSQYVTDTASDQPSLAEASRISPNVSTLNSLMSAGGSPVWNVDASGNWGTGSNWWNGTVPSGTGVEAVLGSVISTSRTVTMDANKTVGTLTIDSASSYTIGGTHTLTVQGTSGTGVIRAYQGSHTISAPLTLVGTSQIQLGQTTPTVHSATLTLSGTLNAGGATIQKQGAGTLIVNNIRSANLQVQQGMVKTASNGGNSGVSHLSGLSISSGAALDMNNNDLIVDYSGSSPFTQIQAWVMSGYSSTVDTTRSGITSSASQSSGGKTILALFDNALVGSSQWDGQTVPADSVIGKYTYFGDTNLDGQVTGDDYNTVDAHFGAAGLSAGIAWWMGDMNQDGRISSSDYDAVTSNLGSGGPIPLSLNAVPEPGLVGLLGCGTLLLRRRCRTRR